MKLRSLFLFVSILLFLSCDAIDKKVIFVGEAEPADFSLSNTRPETFAFEIPSDESGPFSFTIELTYFENQLQGWDALPLYYTLLHPDGRDEDKRFSLKLKDEKGVWLGNLKENNTDRLLEQTIVESLVLTPGKYSLSIFGDSKDLAKPILGIVRLTLKVNS